MSTIALLFSPAAMGVDSQPLRSTGLSLSIVESADGGEAYSYGGAGRPLGLGEIDDKNASISVSEIATKPQTFEFRLDQSPINLSVISTDDRVRINPVTTYPYRASVLITFSTPTGNKRCTGWMLGPNAVGTSAHCVHRGTGGTAGFYNVGSYRIFPGANGSVNGSPGTPYSPYGACRATRLFAPPGYMNNKLENQDYGAIRLDCNIGRTVGWYGFFWTSGSLLNLPTLIDGYPGDKPLTMWRSFGRVTVSDASLVFYQNDTETGESGSAVWYSRSSKCSPCVMAIHSHGVHGPTPPFTINNNGPRITQTVFNNLVAWINAQ